MDDKDFRRSSNVEDRTGEGFLPRYSSWFTPSYTLSDIKEMLKHPMTPARDLLPNNFGTAQVPPSPLGVDAGYNDIPSDGRALLGQSGPQSLFGLPKIPLGMLGVADGTGTRPTNSAEDMNSLQKLYAAAVAHNRTPNGRVSRGFDQFGPQNAAPYATAPMLPTPPTPEEPDMGPPALSAKALAQGPPAPPAAAPQAVIPMPTARPPEAPQAPEPMGFFQRNSAMMRDPTSGDFLDPQNAARAQASGPDVINKLLSYFHQKDA